MFRRGPAYNSGISATDERNKATKLNNRLVLKQDEPRLGELDWVYASAWTHHGVLRTAACFLIGRLVRFQHFASPWALCPTRCLSTGFYSPRRLFQKRTEGLL